MEKKNKYYVVRDKALPEVLQKVVEVKRLLETDKRCRRRRNRSV